METLTEIYMALLGEAVEVYRPVRAIHQHGDGYMIIGQNFDSEDEQWQFSTGEAVRCRDHTFSDGQTGLLAYEKA